MFDALVIVALLLTGCVVGLLIDHRRARLTDAKIDRRIAELRVACELSRELDRRVDERAAKFRSENHG